MTRRPVVVWKELHRQTKTLLGDGRDTKIQPLNRRRSDHFLGHIDPLALGALVEESCLQQEIEPGNRSLGVRVSDRKEGTNSLNLVAFIGSCCCSGSWFIVLQAVTVLVDRKDATNLVAGHVVQCKPWH